MDAYIEYYRVQYIIQPVYYRVQYIIQLGNYFFEASRKPAFWDGKPILQRTSRAVGTLYVLHGNYDISKIQVWEKNRVSFLKNAT